MKKSYFHSTSAWHIAGENNKEIESSYSPDKAARPLAWDKNHTHQNILDVKRQTVRYETRELLEKVDTGLEPNKELKDESLYSDASLPKDKYTPAKVKRKFEHLSSSDKLSIIDLFTNKGLCRSMISSTLFIPYSTVWRTIKEGNVIKEKFENIQQYSNSNMILNSKLKQEIENYVRSNEHPFTIKDI